MTAGRRVGLAACGADRFVDRQDRIGDAGVVDRAGQQIAAARTTHRLHQAGPAQFGEELFEIGQRNFLAAGNIGERDRSALAVGRQIS